jgi:malate dehydrogenase
MYLRSINVGRKKITVVGAGNVGATSAYMAANKNLGDIVLVDIVEGLAEGKALDISQAGGVEAYSGSVVGTTDWGLTAESDIVIVTSGLPRKPGMSRDDLLAKNVEIVNSVSNQIAAHSPEAFVIVVCNPLDAMVYTASKVTGFAKNKVMGMAGALDSARFAYLISAEFGVDIGDIKGVLMGGHGDSMVPLPSYTTAGGIPVTELLSSEKIAGLVQRTRKGGIEIVNLMGTSAFYAPAAGAVKMAEAILRDRKNVMSCCAYCNGQYGIDGLYVGVPVIIGAGGIEKVVELELSGNEKAALEKSVAHVKGLVDKVDKLL